MRTFRYTSTVICVQITKERKNNRSTSNNGIQIQINSMSRLLSSYYGKHLNNSSKIASSQVYCIICKTEIFRNMCCISIIRDYTVLVEGDLFLC